MRQNRLIWQFYPPFLLILLLALIALTLYDALSLGSLYRRQTLAHLEDLAQVVSRVVLLEQSRNVAADLDALTRGLARDSRARITIIAPDGTVLGDSSIDAQRMDNHGDRREVKRALAGGVGRATRYSYTTRQQMLYVTVPIVRDGAVVGAVRTALPASAAAAMVRPVYFRILLGGLVIAFLAAGMSLLASRRVTRQVSVIRDGAERFARGDVATPLPVAGAHGLAEVAGTLNRIGAQFQDRMHAVLRQRNELEAVLASMAEGVIAVDGDDRIISLNEAAARQFQVERAEAVGRSMQEAVRNTDLQRFVALARASQRPVEGDIVLYHVDGERTLYARGTVLRDGGGKAIGGLVVLNDVTRLRRLETARRDFVANVSHELRTPVTTIQGYAETLLDGALGDPETARRFVETIHRQAERLNALIADLLTLARIEQDAVKQEVGRREARVHDLLENAVQACASQAEGRGVRLDLECDSEIVANVNPGLVEQAVVNLMDNAIKYSHPDGAVRIVAVRENGGVAIHVCDQGCGISPEHLPRLFERFYRVDKDRSRKQGGTGLGLAIVKHIARLHGGRADVESAPGRGSTFSLHLPG